jgi:YbbR domain-containing protein
MARRSASNFWFGLLAIVVATFLWFLAHRSSMIERGYDIPVVFNGVPERLVITDQSADVVNIQVQGSRAAHRNFFATKSEYGIDVAGAKPGPALYELDLSRIELPRGSQIVSRSPASVEVEFERRGRKSVQIRPDLEGEPADGFVISEIAVDPPRVWLTGARSAVLRLSEVVTETIQVAGLDAPLEREARLSLGSEHVWMEESRPVTVRISVEVLEPLDPLEGTLEPLEGNQEGEQQG